jgi:hypothetical protein
MTIHHLFKNFLEDKQVYHNNVVYWKDILSKIVKDKSENYDWFEPQFINGENFFDGNPMVSLICHSPKKAVRIIQEDPESGSIEIGAWVDSFYLSEDEPIKELVISLELSSESEKLAKNLIKKWIIEDLNDLQMSDFIDKQIYPSSISGPINISSVVESEMKRNLK